jgi:hypothetical protein
MRKAPLLTLATGVGDWLFAEAFSRTKIWVAQAYQGQASPGSKGGGICAGNGESRTGVSFRSTSA